MSQDETLVILIEKLEQLLDEERADLSLGRFAFIAEFNARKSQLLFDINRAMRNFTPAEADDSLQSLHAQTRRKLAANRAVLAVHLEAAREIVALILQTIQEAESDGTYDRTLSSQRASSVRP